MTSFKKIAVTSAVLATTLVAGVLSPVAVHADELTKVQAQSQNNATGDAPVVVTDVQTNAETTEAPKTEAAAPAAAAKAPEAKEDTSKATTETTDTASKKDTQEQKKAEEKPIQQDIEKAPDKADFDDKNTLPYGSYEKNGSFSIPNSKYNKDTIETNLKSLVNDIFEKVAPGMKQNNVGQQVIQTISEVDQDGKMITELSVRDYTRSINSRYRTFGVGITSNSFNQGYIVVLTNLINNRTSGKLVSITYDPITNKFVKKDGTETDDLTKELIVPYKFSAYNIPQRDGYISYYYSDSDKDDKKPATKGTVIPEYESIGAKGGNWYVFYVKKPEDKTPADNNKHEDQNPPKNDPENKNPKDQTSSKEDPVDPTIIVDPVIPAEDPVVVEKPDAEVVKPEETPDLPEAPEPAKEPEKVEVIAPAATVQASAPAVVKAAPQAVKAAPAAKKLPQTGNSQTIKAAGLALVSLGLLGLAFADLKKKRA